MNEAIKGYTDAVCDLVVASGSQEELVVEVGGLLDTLERAEELRWALSDAAVPVQSRRSIVEELLTGKLGGIAVGLISFVVTAGKPGELVGDIRWVLGHLPGGARHREGGSASGAGQLTGARQLEGEEQVPSGRSAARLRLEGYAAAVFAELEEPGRISEVEDELFRIARTVEGSRELRKVLADWYVPGERRAGIVEGLLADKADRATVALVSYAIRLGPTRDVVGVLDWLVERAAAERDQRVGEVRAATELTGEQLERLRSNLARVLGRQVELRTTIDPSVIGGIAVRVGDLVIDGTISRRLAEARRAMVPASMEAFVSKLAAPNASGSKTGEHPGAPAGPGS